MNIWSSEYLISLIDRLISIDCVCFRTGGIPARTASGQKLLLYVGIIDILQSYHIRKKLEHTFKSVLTDGVSN